MIGSYRLFFAIPLTPHHTAVDSSDVVRCPDQVAEVLLGSPDASISFSSDHSSLRTNLELREALQSLEAQLECLYAERDQRPRISTSDSALVASLVAQLEALYAEREQRGSQRYDELESTVASMSQQLNSLYAEREETADIRELAQNLEWQLDSIYREREEEENRLRSASPHPVPTRQGVGAADPHDPRLDPKESTAPPRTSGSDELASRVQELQAQLDQMRRRAKMLAAALVDCVLADSVPTGECDEFCSDQLYR